METQNILFGTTENEKDTKMTPGYQIICSCCGDSFFLSRDNAAWFLNKGLELPKKCPVCRAKLKHSHELH